MSDNQIRTFRDLKVWQKSKVLVKQIYEMCKRFPKEEVYALSSQMRNSAVSVPSNIAEGYGRHSRSDYIRFLRIASGSLYELETQVEISFDLDYIEKDLCSKVIEDINEIERMLSSLIKKLEAKTQYAV